MVFSLCLRSLLEHQKNQKKPLEKHFKNSMLTRYLRDYLEGRKKMTLILNVKPGDDDYLDTSFLLRQASPYMKKKYTSLEDSSDLISQKRSNISLVCQQNKKKRKVHKPEVIVVEQKENIVTDNIIQVSERDKAQHKFLNSELRRVSRSEEIMTNFARALWTVLKQYKHKLLESEDAAERMKELIRDKDIQIMELKKELEVLNSCCSCKNFPIVEDTFDEQDDAASSGQSAWSLVSLSNKPVVGSCDAAVGNFHLIEEVSEEFKCHGPESSSAHCGLKGESDNCSTSGISLILDEELSSRHFMPEKSCSPDAFGPKFDTEKGNTEVKVQVVYKELDRPGSFAEETSAHAGGVTPASSHSDNPSDQSLTETGRFSLSPQFTSCSKKGTIEQREKDKEELSKITVEDIQHDINTREVKHPDSLSSSWQVNSDTEDVSPSQSSLELHGMVASQKTPEELEPESERREPAVEESIVEYGCSQPPDQIEDYGGMLPCLPKETTAPVKASIAPNKDSQAEEIADRRKDPLASRPRNTKKIASRRLQPVAAMMLKEFTGADINADVKREERGKSSSSEATGKSDALIQLLKGRLVPLRRA
uniref:Kinesin motor domain-containing protein n=1 Tax=Arundo donax TaxID=35708 RepID=A0A0A9CMI4_ARUDO